LETCIKTILEKCGYPTEVVVLDWETYFDSQYKMGSGGLSTAEYVCDERFDFLGLAVMGLLKGNTPKPYYITPGDVKILTPTIQKWCNKHTLVMHNANFDGLILAEHFGVYPKYCIDTIGLSRYFEARARHSLEECAKRYGLPAKGELAFAKGKHWGDLTPPDKIRLKSYAKNDVAITAGLFEIMLPMLPRPEKELLVMQDLLQRFWVPQLEFDFDKAEELRGNMEDQISKKLLEIDWL